MKSSAVDDNKRLNSVYDRSASSRVQVLIQIARNEEKELVQRMIFAICRVSDFRSDAERFRFTVLGGFPELNRLLRSFEEFGIRPERFHLTTHSSNEEQHDEYETE